MRPRGDGDLERSRSASGIFGDRYPFELLPLTVGGEAGIFGLDRRLGRRCRVESFDLTDGLRELPDPGSSSETPVRCCRRAAERVIGAKYPSDASALSEREGDGEMTRGVSGTVVGVAGIVPVLTVNGGSTGVLVRPERGRTQVAALSQTRLPQRITGLPNDSMVGGYVRGAGALSTTGKRFAIDNKAAHGLHSQGKENSKVRQCWRREKYIAIVNSVHCRSHMTLSNR